MTFTEIFTELCPIYIVYGMTYEQYWYGDPWMASAYAQAYLLKRKVDNENAWILGAYMTHAVSTVMANSFGKKREKYLSKPMEIFPKTEMEKQQEIREERRKLINWLDGMRKRSNRRQKNTGSEPHGEP